MSGVRVFFAAEDLFDKAYDVKTHPLTVGWPHTFRVDGRATLP